jgi:hypothetical protein
MADPVRLGDVVAGEPFRTGWSAPHGPAPEGGSLDQLTDVSGVAEAPSGSVLVKDSDGVLRPRAYKPMRGSAVRMTPTPPTGVPPDAEPGDIHLARLPGDIAIYQLEET